MMIQFFSGFEKKENSTKRPAGAVDMSLTGVLKEPCSMMNPVIKIERLANDANPCIYSYAIIPSFQRFYFVEDWVWADGLWEVHLKEDVLGTWKNAIGTQTEYVLRTDSTTDFNGEISDMTYPATTDFTVESQYAATVFPNALALGCYIVGIISGTDTDAIGAITYYAMSTAEFGDLKKMLFSEDNLDIMGIIDTSTTPPTPLVADLAPEVLKTIYNPYQYIVSCMWMPFEKTAIPTRTPLNAIKIGWWGYPLSGDRLYAQTIEFQETLPIHVHPQSSARGQYLNYAPYTRRTLIGRFGTVALDSSYFNIPDQVGVSYMVDLITGQCRTTIARLYYVPGDQDWYGDSIAERTFMLGVPIQLAQVGVDYLGTATTALGGVSGIVNNVARGDITGTIASVASGIYNTLQSAMPQVETSGANGSFISPETRTELLEHFAKIVDEDIHHRGRPLCELRQLNTLSGFILCAEGDIDINCYDNERMAIKKYLTDGFFWE